MGYTFMAGRHLRNDRTANGRKRFDKPCSEYPKIALESAIPSFSDVPTRGQAKRLQIRLKASGKNFPIGVAQLRQKNQHLCIYLLQLVLL